MSQALIYSMTVPATPNSDSYLCFHQDRWKDSVVNRMLGITVPVSNVFNPFESPLSEKQTPRFIGHVST